MSDREKGDKEREKDMKVEEPWVWENILSINIILYLLGENTNGITHSLR